MQVILAIIYAISMCLCFVVGVHLLREEKKLSAAIYFFCCFLPLVNTILAVGGIIVYDIEDLT